MISQTVQLNEKLDYELEHIGASLESMLVAAKDGVVAGLDVSSVGSKLQVTSGVAYIGGTRCDSAAIDGLSVDMTQGKRGFVVLSKTEVLAYSTDPYGRSVIVGTSFAFSIEVRYVDDQIGDSLILATFEVVAVDSTSMHSKVLTKAYMVPHVGPFVVHTYTSNITSCSVVGYVGSTEIPFTRTYGDVSTNTYSVDVDTGAILFHSSNADTNLSVNLTYNEVVQDLELTVAYNDDRYENVRPQFTLVDAHHSRMNSPVGNNVHGTTFNDMNIDFPLHSQIFDAGFHVVTKTDRDGIPGKLYIEHFKPYAYQVELTTRHRFEIDMFGELTGTAGRQYIKLAYTPLMVSYVVNKITRVPVMFDVLDNVIAFPRTADFDAFEVEVGYTAVEHLDARTLNDSSIEFRGTASGIVISQGLEVKTPDNVQCSLSEYRDVKLNVIAALDSQSNVVTLPSVLDSDKLSNNSSNFSSPKELYGQTQLQLTLRNSPLRNALKPPAGRITLSSSLDNLFGRRRFVYTYSKQNVMLSVVDNASSPIGDSYNLSGSHMYRMEEIVESDMWRLINSKTSVVVSDSAYSEVTAPSFKLMTGEATSSRNRRGYFEFTGKLAAPAGPKAKCSIVSTGSILKPGDSFTYTHNLGSITKTYVEASSVFLGSTSSEIAQSIAQTLTSNPLVVSTGISVTFDEQSVTIVTSSSQAHVSTYFKNNSVKVTESSDPSMKQIVIDVLTNNLAEGDSITLSVDGLNSPINMFWSSADNFLFSESTLESIRQAFASDSRFSSIGASIYIEGDDLVLISGDAGTLGNSNNFSTTSSAVISQGFSGGLANKTPSFNDIAGMVLVLEDEQQFDATGVFHLYCTDNLDAGGSEDVYHHIGDITQNRGQLTYYWYVDPAYFTNQTLDLSDEFRATVLVSGTDASGASVSETLEITPLNFCEYIGLDETNELQFIRTSQLFAKLNQWVVVNSNGAGTSELVVLSSLTSNARDLYELCEMQWNGAKIQSKVDRRRIIQSTTLSDSSHHVGEAMNTMATVFGLV
jgi:hypothetical protein